MSDLRFPIGRFEYAGEMTGDQRNRTIDEIAMTPEELRSAVSGLSAEQLDTPYRPEGWTVRQVVHHLPDSHLNSYVRFKLALTEDNPTIRPYHEDRWAELEDARNAPIELSLALLDSLHKRWVLFLRSLSEPDFKRTFTHPELGAMTIDRTVALYSWHGRHHVGHITSLRDRMGWD
jgi:uncharacterized damage-inducible protein DinB